MKNLFLSLCLLLSIKALAQQPVYTNLSLEGGGIRGIAYGGALSELDSLGILPHIKRVAGTSAGAIQAALLSVGYTPEEITSITFKTPMQQFNDGRFIFFGGTNRLFKQYGWYRGDKFTEWLGKQLEGKTGNADITFAELHELALQNKARDLYVTGTNLTDQCMMVFSYETFPNMQVKHAVRASMSIPLYYRAVLLDQDGNVVTKPHKGQQLDIIVDGGILANFPLTLFDDPKYLDNASPSAKNYDTHGVFHNPQTLGLRLDRDEQIAYDEQQAGLAPYNISKFSDYMGAFYTIIKESLNRQNLTAHDWDRTVSISTAGFSPRVRKLSEVEKSTLLASGRKGVQAFLNRAQAAKHE
ncbi:patatin-like phospholipase family protein [Pontibacter cellulosilyticus]|uniref:Patatin-like phospholipase family protein n=1 Tax=Pontibacter cellulosilyticus TaxID=1720253 RepID=A0A923SK34_9BACT|nr:patatin-like phospholipase family protein [Pontibacter cellulosilyticus]MBC5994327.1 patatin-like phospholipase family protein [Pontibacter cellulosilyticus]